MLGPQDFLSADFAREDLLANMHYLGDSKLVELMMGYTPPWFAAVRITAAGIDLVENRLALDMGFPAGPNGDPDGESADILHVMERLVEEVEFTALDGEKRQALQRDVQYLRTELDRPEQRWRIDVIETVLGWIEGSVDDPEESLPSLSALRKQIATTWKSR